MTDNNPIALTPDKLMQMVKKPIYVVPTDPNADWEPHWDIYKTDGRSRYATANSISKRGGMWFLHEQDYGTTWLAYLYEIAKVSDNTTNFLPSESDNICVSPFKPQTGQTAVIDTVKSQIFWIRTLTGGKNQPKKYRLCNCYFDTEHNVVLAPYIHTEDFEDKRAATQALMNIKQQPHMAYMAIVSPLSFRMFEKITDTQLVMQLPISHIEDLESELAETKSVLNAYRHTGLEPCDCNNLSYWKDKAERLESENQKLIFELENAIKAKEHAEEENATIIAMINTNF